LGSNHDPGSWTLGDAAAAWAGARRIRVGRLDVRYREAGSGTPLVLIHGLGVSADYWVRNGPPLAAAGMRVLAPDLPGFGRTHGPAAGLGVRAQADSIRAWALAMHLDPAVYLGHSLSCQTVLELGANYPDSVRGVILVAPTGDGPAPRRLVRQAIGLARDLWRESPLLAALVFQSYLRAGPARILRTWRMGAAHDPLEVLAGVRVRGTVIVGEKDPVVDLEFAEKLASRLVDGVVTVVPNAPHAVIFDETGAFNQAVVSFVRGLA
jgi:pimeloyl-ACP methyl ester carboxylesterase